MTIPTKLVAGGLALAGIVNLLPIMGAAGVGWLRSLYGFEISSPDLEILLRHRAILFGILGVLLLAAVFRRELRGAAALAAAASMASFIAIALMVGGYGPAITKIVVADIIGLLALVPMALTRLAPSRLTAG